MWLCRDNITGAIEFASDRDLSGRDFSCEQVLVKDTPGFSSPSVYRNLLRIFEILSHL